MAEHNGSWYPLTQQGVQWDASGNPYYNTSDGMKAYIPPIAAAQYQSDPRMLAWAKSKGAQINYGNDANGNPTANVVSTGAPASGFTGGYTWNSEQGGYDKNNFFDSPLGALILGGSAVAAPFALSALGVGAPATVAAPASAAPAATISSLSGVAGTPLAVSAPAAASAAPAVAGAAAPAAGASTALSLPKILTSVAPIAATVTNRLMQPSTAGNGVTSIDPALLSRLSTLLDLAQQRVQSARPVHDAAMQMALRMAPVAGSTPRIDQAIANTANPLPTGPNYSPGTLAALQKLAGR